MGCIAPVVPPKKDKISKVLPSFRGKYALGPAISFDSTKALFLVRSTSPHEATCTLRIFYDSCSQQTQLYNKFSTVYAKFAKIKSLKVPYVVPYTLFAQNQSHFYCVMDTSNFPFTATEALINGLLRNEGALKESIRGVFEALSTLHSVGIAHREISPCKLLYEAGHKFHIYDFSGGIETSRQLFTSLDPAFVAPEIASGETPTIATDVWALGATIEFLAKSNGLLISAKLKDMLDRMMERNTMKRISISEALKHEWFSPEIDELPVNDGVVSEEVKQSHSDRQAIMAGINLIVAEKRIAELKEVWSRIKSMDKDGTGKISYPKFMEYVFGDSSAHKVKWIGLDNLQVNYTELLCSSLALSQFITQERMAELFRQLSNTDGKIYKRTLRNWLTSIGQGEYRLHDINLNKLICDHQAFERQDLGVTFEEFYMLCQNIDVYLPEDLLTVQVFMAEY